jgi:hypothetical protein
MQVRSDNGGLLLAWANKNGASRGALLARAQPYKP